MQNTYFFKLEYNISSLYHICSFILLLTSNNKNENKLHYVPVVDKLSKIINKNING